MPVNRTLLVLACLALASSLEAAPGKAPRPAASPTASGQALGLVIGLPTGLSYRLGLSATESLEGRVSWDFGASKTGGGSITVGAQWTTEFRELLVVEGEPIPPYVGLGAVLAVGDAGLGLGLRVPLGLVWRPRGFPIELALELGLGLHLLPATSLLSDGGLAVRYRF